MTAKRTAARDLGGSRLAEWTGPLVALVITAFCFGVLLSRLGFFQDDWHHVFYGYWQGAGGLERFLRIDRGPFAWPLYAAYFKLLGFAPAAWHWWLMLVRFLTVLVFWFISRRIWPQSHGLAAWLAVIFAIYPVFTLQPLAVAYALHWTMYLVLMLSILAMIEAVRRPARGFYLTALALLLQASHLVMIEYFAGLELARPVILWLALSGLDSRERLKQALSRSLPYLAVLLTYVAYRSSFGAIFGYDRFDIPGFLAGFLQSPLATLQLVAQSAIQDLLYIVFSQWQAAVDPAVIELSRPSAYLILIGMAGSAALAFFALRRVDGLGRAPDVNVKYPELFTAGLLLIILSMLPFWLTGFSIFEKNQMWSQRLALASMPGASLLVVGAIFSIVERAASRNLVLSVVLGLAVGIHMQTARSFQASWDKQRQFYWQMHWRAPALQRGTMLVADQEILFYMGIYPTAFALNVLYPQVTVPPEASYWFNAGFEHVDFAALAAGGQDSFEKYATTFSFDANDILAVTFEPGMDQCLWTLRPGLEAARTLTAPARTWLEVSNESRIVASPAAVPPRVIFGPEPPRNWCFFYESGDLARQNGEWEQVIQLWDRSAEEGFRAPNGVEMLPFIEAYARKGDWAQAQILTRQAQVLPDRSVAVLCGLWSDLASTTAPSPARDEALAQVSETLTCTP